MQDELPPHLGTSIIDARFLTDLASLWAGPLQPDSLDRIERTLRVFVTARSLAYMPYPATLGIPGYEAHFDPEISALMKEPQDVGDMGDAYYNSGIQDSLCFKLQEYILDKIRVSPYRIFCAPVKLTGARDVFTRDVSGSDLRNYDWLDADWESKDWTSVGFGLTEAGHGQDPTPEQMHYLLLMRQMNFAKFVIEAARRGASVLSRGPGYQAALNHIYHNWPDQIFADLDAEYKQFLNQTRGPGTGVCLPVMISLIFSVCTSRQDIPRCLGQMRREYQGSRDELWSILNEMWREHSVSKQTEILQRLREASSSIFPSAFPQRYNHAVDIGLDILDARFGGAIKSLIKARKPAVRVGSVQFANRLSYDLRENLLANHAILQKILTPREMERFRSC